jgi:4-hydroxy-3-methylbut-2-enyl diphosphate reductase IspH
MACPSDPAEANSRGLDWLDATCPLVSKVHRQAERQVEAGVTSCSSATTAIPK